MMVEGQLVPAAGQEADVGGRGGGVPPDDPTMRGERLAARGARALPPGGGQSQRREKGAERFAGR